MINPQSINMYGFGKFMHFNNPYINKNHNEIILTRFNCYNTQRYVENLKLNDENKLIKRIANQLLQYIIYIFNGVVSPIIGYITTKHDRFNIKMKANKRMRLKHYFTELLYYFRDKISEVERYIKNKYNLIIHIFDIALYDFNVDILF